MDLDLDFTEDEIRRYSRHILLQDVGGTGQAKLKAARVLVVGAGGLGSPIALYLAAAGIGTIGIVDDDRVELSNLQRQILHNTDRIGDRKVDSAKKTLTLLNPDVNVVSYDTRLAADNVLDIIDGYDVIIDGADNFPSRYLLNDASLKKKIPVVHGSIFRFEGQATVFHPYVGPCYRCMVPEPPPAELAPSCAEAGVLGDREHGGGEIAERGAHEQRQIGADEGLHRGREQAGQCEQHRDPGEAPVHALKPRGL